MRTRGSGFAVAPPSVRDPQIANIFRNMRGAARMTREAVARRLSTTPGTVEDLENGAIAMLPPWPETVRIVRAYCEILRLDPEPLLWRIQKLQQGGSDEMPLPTTRRTGSGPLALRKAAPREREPREGGGLRRILVLAALPMLAAGLAYFLVLAPAVAYRALSLLPDSVAPPARAGLDTIVLYAAPRRDGFRWIDIGDPRLRKVDKLRTKARK